VSKTDEHGYLFLEEWERQQAEPMPVFAKKRGRGKRSQETEDRMQKESTGEDRLFFERREPNERTCRNCRRLDMKKQKCEHFQQEGKAYPVTILGQDDDDIDVPVFLSKNEVDKAYADGTLGSDDEWTQCINWKEKRRKNK